MPERTEIMTAIKMAADSLGRKQTQELLNQIGALSRLLSAKPEIVSLTAGQFTTVLAMAMEKTDFLPTIKQIMAARDEWSKANRPGVAAGTGAAPGCRACNQTGAIPLLVVTWHGHNDWTAQEYGCRCTCARGTALYSGLPLVDAWSGPGVELYPNPTLAERKRFLRLPEPKALPFRRGEGKPKGQRGMVLAGEVVELSPERGLVVSGREK